MYKILYKMLVIRGGYYHDSAEESCSVPALFTPYCADWNAANEVFAM